MTLTLIVSKHSYIRITIEIPRNALYLMQSNKTNISWGSTKPEFQRSLTIMAGELETWKLLTLDMW
jgi:hypothetical protein